MTEPTGKPIQVQVESEIATALYTVYSDDNYDKEGSSQAYIGDFKSLQEALGQCEAIVGQSIRGCAHPGQTGPEVYRCWHFGGTTAFIKGSDVFSADDYARKLSNELFGAFDRDMHREALRQRILDAGQQLRKVNDSDESLNGYPSVRACREETEQLALEAIVAEGQTLEMYGERVLDALGRMLEELQHGSYAGSSLMAGIIREYMLPAVEGYFAENPDISADWVDTDSNKWQAKDTRLLPMPYSDFFTPFLTRIDPEQINFWKYYPHHLFSIGIGCLRRNPGWGPEQGRPEMIWLRRWLPGQGLLLAALEDGLTFRCETIHVLNSEQFFPETVYNRVLQLELASNEALGSAIRRYCCEPWFKAGDTEELKQQRTELEAMVMRMEKDAEDRYCLLLWVGHSEIRTGLLDTDLSQPWPEAPVLNPRPHLPEIVLFIGSKEREALVALRGGMAARASLCILGLLGYEEPWAYPKLNSEDVLSAPEMGHWLSLSPLGPAFHSTGLVTLASQLRAHSPIVYCGKTKWYDEVRQAHCLLYPMTPAALLALMEEHCPEKPDDEFISCAGPDDDWEYRRYTETLRTWLETEPSGALYLTVVIINERQTHE